MLQNARVTAFTVSEFLRENQLGERGVKLHPPPRLGLNTGTTNETFQQFGKQDSFRHILKSSASTGVEITSVCWKFLPCQAKCPVSKTNKTPKTSRC